MSVDEILFHYGDPGKYQVLIFILLWFSLYTMSLNNLLSIFSISRHPHHCKIEDGFSINESIPRTEIGELNSCLMYINATDHSQGTISCINGWEHFPSNGEWSIVQEWDLVCEYSYLSAMINTNYFIGVMVGSLIFGYLTDKLGRKVVLLITLYSYTLISFASGFSPNFSVYMVIKFLVGALVQGTYSAAYVYIMEIFKPRLRSLIAICIQILWPISTIIVVCLAYFLKNWKLLDFVTSVPFVFTIIYIWILPECPRWLIAVGNEKRAKIQLERFAQFNKIPPLDNLEYEIKNIIQEKSKNTSKTYGIKDIFGRRKMKIISLTSCVFYFSGVFAFYAISYSITALGISIHMSMLISGLIELFIVISMYFWMQRFGRRTLARFAILLVSVLSFLVTIMEVTLPSTVSSLTWIGIVASIGRATLTAFFSALNVYVNELSPTAIRTSVSGMANFVGRIGGILAPQIMLLEDNVWKPLPFLLCGILTLLSALLTIPLPETRGKSLPEVPRDVDKLWFADS